MANEEYQIPIFLINGQLDSGKTRFISDTIAMGQFAEAKNKLLIVCEEGEEEYSEKLLKDNGVDMVVLEKEELKKAMEENLTALVGKIPGLLTLEFVACPFGSSTHDMALVSTFEKEEDISVYAKHPAHVAVADTYVRPFVTERACLDY